jgi:hypothetical protein
MSAGSDTAGKFNALLSKGGKVTFLSGFDLATLERQHKKVANFSENTCRANFENPSAILKSRRAFTEKTAEVFKQSSNEFYLQ